MRVPAASNHSLLAAFASEASEQLAVLSLENPAALPAALETLRFLNRGASLLKLEALLPLISQTETVLKRHSKLGALSAEVIAACYEAISAIGYGLEALEAAVDAGRRTAEDPPEIAAAHDRLLALGTARGAWAERSVAREPLMDAFEAPLAPAVAASVPAAPAGEPEGEQTIRVSKDKLDHLLGMIGRLVITKNTFIHLTDRLQRIYHLPQAAREVRDAAAAFADISDELKAVIREVRMQKVQVLFQRFPRVIRDLSRQVGKHVALEISGGDIELDRTILEKLGDPLMHLVRNAIDHGLEPPADRLKAGKSEEGRVTLSAAVKGSQVHIAIRDDGRGLDARKLKDKVLEKGLLPPAEVEAMSDAAAYELIFLPGFSTAAQVTDISGRGVGMDVVRSNIQALGGRIVIASELGVGTTMTLLVPRESEIDIVEGLLVTVGEETYALGVEHIRAIVKVPSHDLHMALTQEFFHFQGDIFPLKRLGELFDLEVAPSSEVSILLLNTKSGPFGLVVDSVLKPQEIVVHPLVGHLIGLPGLRGSTILGDGRVLLILDPEHLFGFARPQGLAPDSASPSPHA